MGYRAITEEQVQKILTLIDKGLNNTETAAMLGVSVATVDRAKRGILKVQQRARQTPPQSQLNLNSISTQSQQPPEITPAQDFQEKADAIIHLLERICRNTEKLLEVWNGNNT